MELVSEPRPSSIINRGASETEKILSWIVTGSHHPKILENDVAIVPFVGTIMLGSLLVALLVGAVWAPSTQGKTLREIEEEREPEPVG